MKSKKSPKKIKKQKPFGVGLDAEQALADTLCNKFLKEGADENDIDDAFVGAFRALTHRMLQIFKTEFIIENVEDMIHIANEEHVCDECESKNDLSKEERNKLH